MFALNVPEDWPLDREPPDYAEIIDAESQGEHMNKHNELLYNKLGDNGVQLMHRLTHLERYMKDSDLTLDEAIEILEYEVECAKENRDSDENRKT